MTVPSPVTAPARTTARTWSIVALTSALVAGLVGAQPVWADETDPPPTPTGSISGVVATEAGASASGVWVVAHRYRADGNSWMQEEFASVGDDGAYTLSGLPDGDYRVEFQTGNAPVSLRREWWQDASDVWSATTVAVADGAAVSGIDPVLAAGATISGTVTDESGAPVQGVSVSATDPTTGMWVGSTYSDAAGAYAIVGLAAGSYVIQFSPLAMSGPVAGEWWDDATSRAGATPVTVGAGATVSGIDAALAPAGSIAGTVTDDTGAPAPSVYVVVYRATADGAGDWVASMTTDPSGAYTITGLAAGQYKVQFSTGGALLSEWYQDAADAASAAVVSVAAGAQSAVDAELATGATISGVVTDEAGAPVPNVTVWAMPAAGYAGGTGAGTMTAMDGSYSIPGLTGGSYKVRFDTARASQDVVGEWWDDASSEASAATLALETGETVTGISPRLAAGSSISGVVRDGDGAPLADVQVTVRSSQGETLQDVFTGADGSYVAHGLATGSYRLAFAAVLPGGGGALTEWWENAADFASADDIAVTVGEPVDGVDVILSEDDGSVVETYSASLSGTVTDALGRPLSEVAVSVEGATWGDGSRTAADGTWSMPGMPAGSYRVSFTAEIDGALFTQWWDGATDASLATVIVLGNAEQRGGIDASLGAAPRVLESSTPKITGPLRVGKTAKAHPRGWTDGTQFAFQWLADGSPIAGATDPSLVLTPELAGVRLSVVVTGSLPGYQSVVETSTLTDPIAAR